MTASESVAIRAEIAEVREMLADLLALMPVSEMMSVPDIAHRRGASQKWLRLEPWRLPNFGKSDEGDGLRRWRRETVRAWYAPTNWEAVHRAEWEAMSFAARREILGVP